MAVEENRIYIGSVDNPLYYFDNENLLNVSGDVAVSIIGEELSADTFEPEVYFEVRMPEIFKPTNYDGIETSDGLIFSGHYTEDLRRVPYSTPIWYYRGNVLIGKFFVSSVERIARTQYRINAVSIIGLLDRETFYGGYYNGDYTFKEVAEQIIGTNGLQIYTQHSFAKSIRSKVVDEDREYIKNTGYLNTRIQTSIYYGGITEEGQTGTSLTRTTNLIGEMLIGQSSSHINPYNYGLYTVARRGSSSERFSGDAEVYVKYGDDSEEYYITTVHPNSMIDIDLNPHEGYFRVNDVSVEVEEIIFAHRIPLVYFGCCVDTHWNPDTQTFGIYYNTTRKIYANYNFYEALYTDTDGSILSHIIPITIRKDPAVYYYDTIRGVRRALYEASVDGSEIVPNDLPGFVNVNPTYKSIIENIGYDYEVAEIPIYGWLPVTTKRGALYQLIFANTINLTKDADGNIMFSQLYSSEPILIDSDRIYQSGSTDYLSDKYMIELTEHAYISDDQVEERVIYDNADSPAVDNFIAIYQNSPIIEGSVRGIGLSIYAANCNAAIVSGAGYIYGKEIEHNQGNITRLISDHAAGETVSVTDATLVTLANSGNVLERLYDYYKSAERIKGSIVLNDEKVGRCYKFINSFGELVTGYISKLTYKVSSVLKAELEMICGYKPPESGNNFSNCVLLINSGTFEVPAEVFEKENPKIRIVEISGGDGGSSGYAGQDGEVMEKNPTVNHANGGAPGEGGLGGRVRDYIIENPAEEYSYYCGLGGEGGAISSDPNVSNVGLPGEETTFSDGTTTYSTAGGLNAPENGIRNFFTGEIYAKKPKLKNYFMGFGGWFYGVTGLLLDREGGYAQLIWINSESEYHAYKPGANLDASEHLPSSFYGYAYGGCGGGSAYGQDGSVGTRGYASGGKYYLGNGGNGGNCTLVPPDILTDVPNAYGYGGYGGGGGGGGGCSGAVEFMYGSGTLVRGTPGHGGYGGKGGRGGRGCILVYY